MKGIQMVVTSDDTSLFLINFNKETKELTFRTTREPKHLQTEKVEIKDDMVYTNLHYFHVSFLENVNKNNDD